VASVLTASGGGSKPPHVFTFDAETSAVTGTLVRDDAFEPAARRAHDARDMDVRCHATPNASGGPPRTDVTMRWRA